jgi:hypothetical protein
VRIEKSVAKALTEMQAGDLESAMLHACNAVDGTARKAYGYSVGNKARFTALLREHHQILGVMAIPGLDLLTQRFPGLLPTGPNEVDSPDFADLIYSIHRCAHGHGDEVPFGFELRPASPIPGYPTELRLRARSIALPESVIPGLVAVAVMAPENAGLRLDHDGPWLSFRESRLPVNEWWGRASDFPAVVGDFDPAPISIKFGEDESGEPTATLTIGDGTPAAVDSPWEPGARGAWIRVQPGSGSQGSDSD